VSAVFIFNCSLYIILTPTELFNVMQIVTVGVVWTCENQLPVELAKTDWYRSNRCMTTWPTYLHPQIRSQRVDVQIEETQIMMTLRLNLIKLILLVSTFIQGQYLVLISALCFGWLFKEICYLCHCTSYVRPTW
jgi:hypothetical protein